MGPKGGPRESPGHQKRTKKHKNTTPDPRLEKVAEKVWNRRGPEPPKVYYRAIGVTFFTISTDPQKVTPKSPKWLQNGAQIDKNVLRGGVEKKH